MNIAADLEQIFETVVPPEERTRGRALLAGMFRDLIRSSVNRLTVSEWAERKRVLPKGLTSLPGPFSWEVTPYLREIADCFSESSPVQRVAVMKGARLGATVGVGENWIGYMIDCAPGPMLYIGADKESAEAAVELRVDRMLESTGLAGKIFAQTEKAHGKKTGDTKSRKDFAGGHLTAIGPNVAAKLRSLGIRYIFFDEVDAYPGEVGEQEGDPILLAERRTDEYERIRKILYVSTPLVDGSSRIKALFEAGDQRYYYVPCIHCGHEQRLWWKDPAGRYRLRYETDERGRVITESVHYECEACGKPWKNEDKAIFLPRGHWKPTAEPSEPNFRSYHLSSLYSPVGFRSWESICREWQAAQNSPTRLRPFVTTVLGEPWVERGEAPRPEFVALRYRAGYRAEVLKLDEAGNIVEFEPATPPEEALLLTAGVDVQADRLELEIVAWGKNKESWSLGYHVLPCRPGGEKTDNLESIAWQNLNTVLLARRGGMPLRSVFVDASYNSAAVKAFCSRYPRVVFPIQGSEVVARGRKLIAEFGGKGAGLGHLDLDVHALRLELYTYLRHAEPAAGQPFPEGYCHFPADYPERYFRMLCAEELKRERTRSGAIKLTWVRVYSRNEAHDARIYALGALCHYADIVARDYLGGAVSWPEFWKWADLVLKPNKKEVRS